MKKKAKSRQMPKAALMAIVAVVLVGGSFALGSGTVLGNPGSLLASAITALTGRPTVLIGRDGASPSGTIKGGVSQTLAIYDISAKNVTHWATLYHLSMQANISASSVSPLSVSNIAMSYHYCIPVGATYGYGWKGGSCGTINITPSSVVPNGNSYTATFDQNIPIYPQQSYGALTISAIPMYQYTNTATKSGSGNATLVVKLTGGSASGDQCKSTSYGYAGCVSSNAVVNIQQGSGNTLTIARPYGYGYNPKTSSVKTPAPTISGVSGPASLNVGQTGTWTVSALVPNQPGATISYSVHWGDEGTAVTAAKAPIQTTATFTHVYNTKGTYQPVFTVSNSGGSAVTSANVVVGGAGIIVGKDQATAVLTLNQASSTASYGVFTLGFDVTAVGSDVYFPNALGGLTFNLTGTPAYTGNTSSSFTSTADRSGSYYVVHSGQTRVFTLITAADPNAVGDYSESLTQLHYATTPTTPNQTFQFSLATPVLHIPN